MEVMEVVRATEASLAWGKIPGAGANAKGTPHGHAVTSITSITSIISIIFITSIISIILIKPPRAGAS